MLNLVKPMYFHNCRLFQDLNTKLRKNIKYNLLGALVKGILPNSKFYDIITSLKYVLT